MDTQVKKMITKYPYDADLKNTIDLVQERVSETAQIVKRSAIVDMEIRNSSNILNIVCSWYRGQK